MNDCLYQREVRADIGLWSNINGRVRTTEPLSPWDYSPLPLFQPLPPSASAVRPARVLAHRRQSSLVGLFFAPDLLRYDPGESVSMFALEQEVGIHTAENIEQGRDKSRP